MNAGYVLVVWPERRADIVVTVGAHDFFKLLKRPRWRVCWG
jgi:hypothetical protein